MLYNIPCRSNPMPFYTAPPSFIDYSTLPMTFKCTEGSTTITFPLYSTRNQQPSYMWNSDSSPVKSMSARVMDGNTVVSTWFDWRAQNYAAIPLTAGQTVELSGQNTNGYWCSGWGNYVNRFILGGNGKMIVYGNISSLFASNVETVRLMNIFLAHSNDNNPPPGDQILTDASKFVIPYKTDNSEGLNIFCRYYALTGGPIFTTTNYNSTMFNYQFEYCSSLMCVEMCIDPYSYVNFTNYFKGVTTTNGLLIKRQHYQMQGKGTGKCPPNWIVLNRTSKGKLYFANGGDYSGLGAEYKDEYGPDPYAWYWHFHSN